MSDPYDSLEDEYDEKKCSSDSIDQCRPATADSIRRICASKSTDNYSFYLNRNAPEDRIDFCSGKAPANSFQEKSFLPKIENSISDKGLVSVENVVVDNNILSKQGLQFNKDGSFTKSPRFDGSELPFVVKEYKNLQFRKKKTHSLNKKAPHHEIQKKDILNCTEKPRDGISTNHFRNASRSKESSEKILTRAHSLPSKTIQSKAENQCVASDNLTDSMKEKLLQNEREKPQNVLKPVRNLKKAKREMHLTETQKISRENSFSVERKERLNGSQNFLSNENLKTNSKGLNTNQKQIKSIQLKISKYQSDILLNTVKPRLNYSERRQLQSGFNPLCLRQWNKKVPSYSNRSNFGDSVREELPEISSATLDRETLDDEDEELFYQKLIERDKNLKQQNQHSTRSEGPSEFAKLNSAKGLNSCKGQREVKESGKNKLKCKQVTKSMSIDLPAEPHHSMNTFKKCSHYCSVDSSPNMSKVELALKAKTYGYMANARNIFRLKTQSEGKFSATERRGNQKINQNSSPSSEKVLDSSLGSGGLSKHNSLPVNYFPKVKSELPRTLKKLPRATKSLCKAKPSEPSRETLKGFVLPKVSSPETKTIKNQKELALERISAYLRSPKD